MIAAIVNPTAGSGAAGRRWPTAELMLAARVGPVRTFFTKGPGHATELARGALAHLDEIDAAIQSAAPEWPITQMARIDKSILRLAIYEILYNNAVPAKAAINEAVELAKSYGSDTSSRFVNGVLGTIYSRSQSLPASSAGSEVT